MKVDFLQITRLSPTSFTISPSKTQITPRYAKPQKNKNMKIKLCLHYNIKLNIYFWFKTFNRSFHINQLWLKLAKGISTFCKVYHYVNHVILRSINHAIFIFNDWGQSIKYNHRVSIFQKKAMRIVSVTHFHTHTISFFSRAKIL